MRDIACYLRVSTAEQNEAGQRAEIERWLAGYGFRSDQVSWYVDKATGDDMDRPEIERLRKDIFRGLITTVVIWKIDRLSRTIRDGLALLCEWCDRGLRVVSVTQQIDCSGPVGKMIAAVLLGIAEIEQETRRERQKIGIEAAKAVDKYRREKGLPVRNYKGRGKGTTKANVAKVKRLKARGFTSKEIGILLGIGRRTVTRYLRGK